MGNPDLNQFVQSNEHYLKIYNPAAFTTAKQDWAPPKFNKADEKNNKKEREFKADIDASSSE